MRFFRSSVLAVLAGGAMALAVATGAAAAEPSAAGLWQKTEDGKPVVWVLVVDRNGVFEGAFAKMFPEGGRQGRHVLQQMRG